MGWFFVMLASACEIGGTIGLNMFSKKKQLTTGILFVGGFALSFLFLYASFSSVQVSVAYTVWIGLGTAGSVLFNMILFKEPKNMIRILSLLLIVIGVVGLKLFA
ncbi:multidrug resistance protein SMR [Bacillus pumilus]|uniref:DMT family transporter n=1 Tax=Bacillus TaxID=1386 RepID=UPI0005A0767C|nr:MULTISPECIES: multidrug efflux SMR transporter [Bacillus]AMM88200.1 multidrug resistance protein SMR [Bacillus pumilus]MDN0041373.1 multidrug efflux SMR transporter [Bacillus aerophilus]KLV21870.1 multidrug resistance protein SMR [Bacillus altitudinis]MCI9886025.1 multidrug efflux SMR transporter [Bacillus altitudinis]MCM3045964.1 multidrug efflux SMR transporter [Bacillus altitudinis]